MAFVILILFLIFYFILWPVCRVAWRGYKLHRRWRQATAGMRGGYPPPPPRPPRKKKKIDPSVGEYVAFEEIACNTTVEAETSADGSSRITVESQIEDATWEEIP